MKWFIERMIGKVLYRLGFQYSVSTGIGGDTTYGYGDLSLNGYWQFPCYPPRRQPVEGITDTMLDEEPYD